MIVNSDRWLFVCSANYVRSPTAEYVARRRGLLASSCGSDSITLGVPLTLALIEWADVIVCMEACHVTSVARYRVHRTPRVYCWSLPDNWPKPYEPQLVSIIERKLDDMLALMAVDGIEEKIRGLDKTPSVLTERTPGE
jgi:predicted protein tyrosine phosphatase